MSERLPDPQGPAKGQGQALLPAPHRAGSWNTGRCVVARVEATAKGSDARFMVTNLPGRAKHLYDKLYRARGQAKILIKDMKT